jgi:hypothetical protein
MVADWSKSARRRRVSEFARRRNTASTGLLRQRLEQRAGTGDDVRVVPLVLGVNGLADALAGNRFQILCGLSLSPIGGDADELVEQQSK